jgi:hypothetical protein
LNSSKAFVALRRCLAGDAEYVLLSPISARGKLIAARIASLPLHHNQTTLQHRNYSN